MPGQVQEKTQLPSHAEVFAKLDRSERPYNTAPVIPVEENKEVIQNTAPVVNTAAAEKVIPPVEVKTEAVKPNFDELSDEEIEALLAKRTGNKVSLKDLNPAPKVLTAAEKAEAEKAEAAESLEWALGTKKIEREFYEKSIVDKSKDKRDIALALFTAEEKTENPKLTDEECAQMFSDHYAEEEDADSWRRKKAVKEMNAVADNYLAQYKVVDGLTEEYRSYKTTAEKQKEYNKTINTISKELPKELSFKVPYETVDGQKVDLEYKIPVDEAIVAKLTKEFTKPGMFEGYNNWKPEDISAEINYHVQARMQEVVIPKLLAQHADKVAEDIMVKLKNARNPQQSIIGATPQPRTGAKAPPSHAAVLDKIK